MAASREDISDWFDRGVAEGADHMIVVCDTYDHEDYPVMTKGDAMFWRSHREHDGANMQRIMEVYDLHRDKAEQMEMRRAYFPPTGPDAA